MQKIGRRRITTSFSTFRYRIERLPGYHDPAQRQQLGKLATRCEGLFELAAIYCRELEEGFPGFTLSEKLGKLLAKVNYVASHPNSALYAEYYHILQRAYPEDTSPEESFSRYRQVAGALVHLREPLGIQTLSNLLGLELEQTQAALGPLSSVVAVPDSDDTPISFYHASFPEFLIPLSASRDDPNYSPYHIHALKHDLSLTDQCLSIMNSMLVRNICDLSNLFMLNKEIPNLSQRLDAHVPAHLRYAVLHWAWHLAPSDCTRVDKLHDWCQGKMMFYLELMSLLGRCDAVLPLLDHAIGWA